MKEERGLLSGIKTRRQVEAGVELVARGQVYGHHSGCRPSQRGRGRAWCQGTKKGSFIHLTFEGSGGAKRVEGEEELVWV